MSSINCSYPGCPGTVSGKGLFCPIHIPQPGEINKYSVDRGAADIAYQREDWASRSVDMGPPMARSNLAAGAVGIIILLALLGGVAYWVFSRFF